MDVNNGRCHICGMARDDLHFRLRIPEDLKKRVERAADENGRSMTAEILERLEYSFAAWPRIVLPVEMRERAASAPVNKRHKAEQEIQAFVFRVAEHFFPKIDDAINQLVSSFALVIDRTHYLNDEEREAIWSKFNRLLEDIHIETLESE